MNNFKCSFAPESATVLIETIPVTSRREEVDGHPSLPCFLSTAWDLAGDCPIDQRLSWGGTLAQATLTSPRILAPLVTRRNYNFRKPHLNCFYFYHGVRLEVCAAHNGRVWLQPVDAQALPPNRPFTGSTVPYPGADKDQAYPMDVNTPGCQTTHKPRGSLAQQPPVIQELIVSFLESEFPYHSCATKSGLSVYFQLSISALNTNRPEGGQLKIPSTRTMYRIISEVQTRILARMERIESIRARTAKGSTLEHKLAIARRYMLPLRTK